MSASVRPFQSGPAAGADVVFTVVARTPGQDDAADTTLAVNLPGSAAITSVSSSRRVLQHNRSVGELCLRDARPRRRGHRSGGRSGPWQRNYDFDRDSHGTDHRSQPGQQFRNCDGHGSGVSSPPPPPSPAPIAAACSNSIPGDNKGNKLRGTSAGDRIRGVGGNDVLRGLGGDDCLNGGRPGNDRLIAGPGGDRLTGEGPRHHARRRRPR